MNIKTGEFIANLRKEKNLTQKELADKLFISDRAVSKWERGICMPDVSLLEKIADILEVSVTELLKGERIENITKQSSDKIVKESILLFQKDYFKKRTTKLAKRIVIGLMVFLSIGYIALTIISQFNYGEIKWSIWGSEYSIDKANFSSKIAKKNSEKFLRALINCDYDTIEEMVIENPGKIYMASSLLKEGREEEAKDIIMEIDIVEYINNLKWFEKEGLKFTKYKYNFFYHNGSDYVHDYDLELDYKGKKYSASLQLANHRKSTSLNAYGYKDYDKMKINNPYINIDNKELIEKIERTFSY